jgi:predicted nucleic acid-binding protein
MALHVWRRTLTDERRAAFALADLTDIPLLTRYDASYVALAEALEVVLLTADRRLTRASGTRCEVELCR